MYNLQVFVTFYWKYLQVLSNLYSPRLRCGYRRIVYAPMSTRKIFYTFFDTEQFCSIFSCLNKKFCPGFTLIVDIRKHKIFILFRCHRLCTFAPCRLRQKEKIKQVFYYENKRNFCSNNKKNWLFPLWKRSIFISRI